MLGQMRRMGLPNAITVVRMLFVPMVAIFLLSPIRYSNELAAAVIVLASFSDWLDGYLARVRAQSTITGKLLDPVADKLLVMAALIPLVQLGRAPAWMVVVLLGREIAVTGLRSIAATQGMMIRVREMGRLKTASQMVAIGLLALNYQIGNVSFGQLGYGALWVALILSTVSGIQYFVSFWGKIDPHL